MSVLSANANPSQTDGFAAAEYPTIRVQPIPSKRGEPL
jgi:hypothetical protein